MIEQICAKWVDDVVAELYREHPEWYEQYGEVGREKCREDNIHHVRHLETAFQLGNISIFTDYAVWLNRILVAHGMTVQHLLDNLCRMAKTVEKRTELTPERRVFFAAALAAALDRLQS
ncbi:hypothetical protein C7445_109105 [Alicyclobacillus sacchari]|uniref:Uncharacterized protein n=1 Tax=Alicyclobacillus sacchari TaxID=392010 RepID=A0A4R8LMJ8_9BACL|nr:hypothetical protein [Alicyclobacillus sacchari]TDY44607.1 hypothetical protein C7445_109105 [Alicyclobacillus sacchari]GMA57964.1 hypothetical protein GCM10025858_24670 [Alicyclobacillus sacchari]